MGADPIAEIAGNLCSGMTDTPTTTAVQSTYRLIARGFDAVLAQVATESWGAQSPCERWSARDVVGHVVDGHRRVVAAVNGEAPVPFGADEDPKAAWAAANGALDAVAGDPDVLAQEIDGPTGMMSAGRIIGQFVTMDLLVHTWDLARAVGADESLDGPSVEAAYEALKPLDAMIRQPKVFGPKLEPPPGADLQTEFLYFLGRRA